MNDKFGVRIKRKVRERIGFTELTPILIEILKDLIFIANNVIERNIIITSINDLKHRVGSEHYRNNAVDIRVWGMSKDTREKIIKYFVNNSQIIAIDEGDHIHIGKRRKRF